MIVSDKDRPQKSTGMREYVGWFCSVKIRKAIAYSFCETCDN